MADEPFWDDIFSGSADRAAADRARPGRPGNGRAMTDETAGDRDDAARVTGDDLPAPMSRRELRERERLTAASAAAETTAPMGPTSAPADGLAVAPATRPAPAAPPTPAAQPAPAAPPTVDGDPAPTPGPDAVQGDTAPTTTVSPTGAPSRRSPKTPRSGKPRASRSRPASGARVTDIVAAP
ncbi:hypothetical protein AX769_13095 [Frondihabitans sp. PAMC 28766]|uniref:hypothetical protein n=1 Tax=Frondihabitans sp. PAMC 28766 TaxID=1795630 RepID=UPI00078ED59E|nr:hypothetical protein [Frondihabitans sp. PAMC 28766]AMM20905.1 hypothetical protein AX769_13095 [Frondihabitans sp. PAMC 28766]